MTCMATWQSLLLAGMMAAGAGHAQDTAQRLPKCEVASVKLAGPKSERGSRGGPGTNDPAHYSFQRATLMDFISTAWHVEYFQVASKQPLDKENFDLDAVVTAGITREQFRLMMRDMLAERFHLRCHLESRMFPAYELVVGPTGLKIKRPGGAAERSKAPALEGFPELPEGPGFRTNFSAAGRYELVRMRAQQQTMKTLAETLRAP